MDAKLKQKWIEALRSGEYEQTRGALTDGHGFCCLGVLCKVAGLEIDPVSDKVSGSDIRDGYRPIYDLVGGLEKSQACSMRNDGSTGSYNYEPHSFAEIADYIEANIPAEA